MAWLFSRQRYRTHRATKCWNVCEANLGSEPSWYAQCVQPYTCRRHWGHRFVSQCYGSTWWPQRHLWLNLSKIKRKDKTFLMDVEWSTPHFTVSVSLWCPQGTILPTLPPRVLQGAAVSGERISQGPPGNVVALGCPVSERSVQPFTVSSLFQDVVLTA